MASYKHGAYGEVGATRAQSAIQAGTVACYVGTAPIHLVRGYADKGLVNTPIKLSEWKQALSAIGYHADWEKFTLCEAVKVHFDNPLGNVGDIYVINVFDPALEATENQTLSVTFTNGRAEVITADAILDTVTIADAVEGTDFKVDYDYTAGKMILTALTEKVSGTVSISYSKATLPTVATHTEKVIGGVTAEGEYSGIAAIELLYNNYNVVANYLLAPGFSHQPAVYNALVTASKNRNGHWFSYVFVDIPIDSNTTIESAITWKTTNGYTSEYATPCWPKGIDNEGKTYHISTLSAWRQMSIDSTHNGIPFETASNKAVPVIKQYFGASSKNAGFDKERGNALNANGIRTIAPHNGEIVLWGGHTGAYAHGVTSDAAKIFDTNIFMRNHILNRFQIIWSTRVDEPMTLQLKDEILNSEQNYLNSLVAIGALIGEPTITFSAADNSTVDMMNGDFDFDFGHTPTPQAKSVTGTVSYTDEGFSVYTQAE